MQQARKDEDKFDIIFDNKKKEYLIDVRRNQTLVEERKAMWKEGTSLARNVILIYVDAIGRPAMHYKLPRTVQFFKKRSKKMSYKKADEPAGKGDEAY